MECVKQLHGSRERLKLFALHYWYCCGFRRGGVYVGGEDENAILEDQKKPARCVF